jgi:hypothetical protein
MKDLAEAPEKSGSCPAPENSHLDTSVQKLREGSETFSSPIGLLADCDHACFPTADADRRLIFNQVTQLIVQQSLTAIPVNYDGAGFTLRSNS